MSLISKNGSLKDKQNSSYVESLTRSDQSAQEVAIGNFGSESTGNSSTSILTSGSTFTGTGEVNHYNQVGVQVKTDQAGALYFDFSIDGANWDSTFPVNGFAVAANISEFHTAVKLGRYFRVRFVNSGSDQTYFRLKTYYGNDFVPSVAPLNQSIGLDADATLTKAVVIGQDPNGDYVNERQNGYQPNFTNDTPLANGASFQTPITDISGYEFLLTELAADQPLTLVGQWYDDINGTNLIRTFTFNYGGNDLSLTGTTMLSQYLRYTVTNNSGSNCTYTRIRVKTTNTTFQGQILPIESFIPTNVLANVTRSILVGKKPDGIYQNVNLDRFGTLNTNIDNIAKTSFDELKTASRYAQIELKSAVDSVSNLRNYVTTSNGTVTVNSTGEYRVATDATLAGSAQLQSGERGRYIAGYEAECGVGVRIPSQTWSGTQYVEWGYFDDDNGIGFGIDATGKYVFAKRSGSYTKIYQSNWNKDTLDGLGNSSNPSGYTLDYEDGVVSQVEFIWYGYGAIRWYINMKDPASERGSVPTLIHTLLPDNQTSIAQPNLPISVRVDNGDQSTSREIFIGGRQFSIYGQPNERFRINGERRVNVGLVNSAWRPLISFRRKSGIGNNQSVELTAVNIVPDANIIYTFVTGGTLTGASFGALTDVSANETIVESDISATAITGGTFFGGEYIATGNARGETLGTLSELDFDFVNSDIVTLVARSISATATVDAVTLNVREQW